MKQTLLFFFLLVATTYRVECQQIPNSYTQGIKEEAEKMGRLLLKSDSESFSEFVFPALIKKMRGNRDLISLLRNNKDSLIIKSITYDKISPPITYKGELQSTLMEIMEIAVIEKKRIFTKSTLIAISKDKGKSWYFVEGNQSMEALKKGLPNLSDSLIFPDFEKPILKD